MGIRQLVIAVRVAIVALVIVLGGMAMMLQEITPAPAHRAMFVK